MSEKGYCFLKAVTVGLKQIIHLSCLGRMELKGKGGGAGGDTIENNRILLYLNTIKQKKNQINLTTLNNMQNHLQLI